MEHKIDKKLFEKIAVQIEKEYEMGGLSSGWNFAFALDVAKKYIKEQELVSDSIKPEWKDVVTEYRLNKGRKAHNKTRTSMKVEKAVKTLTEALKKDAGFRETYKANIALAFKDEYARRRLEKNHVNSEDVHEIANKAADNFLDLWCR